MDTPLGFSSPSLLLKSVLFHCFLVFPCLSVFLSQTPSFLSPYCWADKALVWSALICQSLQWCYLFMNSQRRDPPRHVSVGVWGWQRHSEACFKAFRAPNQPPTEAQSQLWGCGRACGFRKHPCGRAAQQHAVLFSVFCQTEIKQLTVRLFQTCVSVFIWGTQKENVGRTFIQLLITSERIVQPKMQILSSITGCFICKTQMKIFFMKPVKFLSF